jgi:pyruvate dehydrogenase E2 component (dihydrolipoamide acetyltransferase)
MTTELIPVPDLGGAESVEVIEILAKVGDVIALETSLVTLESDKASMEVPSPKAGKIVAFKVKVGDKVREGMPLVELDISTDVPVGAGSKPAQVVEQPAPVQTKPQSPPPQVLQPQKTAPVVTAAPAGDARQVYAGPAVRKLARELGVDLTQVSATGPRGRLQKEDLHSYIRAQLEKAKQGGGVLPKIPEIDFSKFGEIVLEPMSKIARVTAENMQRSWLNVPHVTQFDEADLTALDQLRATLKGEGEKRGIKLTPMAFLLKASALALKEHPRLNTSLHHDGKQFVRKKYIHIGMAVDTPAGLMVPVIRDVDQKDIWQLAQKVVELSGKAREGKLKPAEMQGGCFTISSLGSIGGAGFTPIVNAPEVAILGVSKAQMKPLWDGKQFSPKNMLPLCLSYDHRAVNGADGGRFLTFLVEIIQDIKRCV